MWRRTYLFLILVRLYFALSPSYLHPDENFQGPEVIAGMLLRLQLLHIPALQAFEGDQELHP
jgi:phosphatidylinositol glycan class Z